MLGTAEGKEPVGRYRKGTGWKVQGRNRLEGTRCERVRCGLDSART